MKLRSYPKVWNCGHPKVENLFQGEVHVQEKIDGLQFSFGNFKGTLLMRSKGAQIYHPTNDKLFAPAVETVWDLHQRRMLKEGWIYRGETLCKPKHNTLAYERAPIGNIILFDIDIGLEKRMNPLELWDHAEGLGIEAVPCLAKAKLVKADQVKNFLEEESWLGGCKVKGVVIKNYNQFGDDGKMLMGKYVSEEFKETHNKNWKAKNPGGRELAVQIGEALATEARFKKAVQHLRDRGELQQAHQDIGPLLQELHKDIEEEEVDQIKDLLWKSARKRILKSSTAGFVQWYKNQLLEGAFE